MFPPGADRRDARARDPGRCDRLPVKAWLGMLRRPLSKLRRRCDTYTNFDSNRAPLNTIAAPAAPVEAGKLTPGVAATGVRRPADQAASCPAYRPDLQVKTA